MCGFELELTTHVQQAKPKGVFFGPGLHAPFTPRVKKKLLAALKIQAHLSYFFKADNSDYHCHFCCHSSPYPSLFKARLNYVE